MNSLGSLAIVNTTRFIAEMPKLRRDKFSHQLGELIKAYPEYSHVLRLLRAQIKKGNEVKIQAKLQQLKDEQF